MSGTVLGVKDTAIKTHLKIMSGHYKCCEEKQTDRWFGGDQWGYEYSILNRGVRKAPLRK